MAVASNNVVPVEQNMAMAQNAVPMAAPPSSVANVISSQVSQAPRTIRRRPEMGL
jgi:hypothetical protein